MLWGHQFQNECSSESSCRIDPATWVLKTATFIARRNNCIKVERPWPWLFDLEKYGSSPLAKSPARSYWLILIVLQNLPNLFQLLGLANMRVTGYQILGKIPLLSLSWFYCLALPIPHEGAKSSKERPKTHLNQLRFSYDVQECLRNLVRITHDFSNQRIRGQSWAEFPIDLRIARTDYGLCESVKIFTNWVWFSHESKNLSIRDNSYDSGPVWNRGIK